MMDTTHTVISEIPVRFVYLAPDGEEDLHTQFDAICLAVPRIGETVVPNAGSKKVVVHNVYHNFDTNSYSMATSVWH